MILPMTSPTGPQQPQQLQPPEAGAGVVEPVSDDPTSEDSAPRFMTDVEESGVETRFIMLEIGKDEDIPWETWDRKPAFVAATPVTRAMCLSRDILAKWGRKGNLCVKLMLSV